MSTVSPSPRTAVQGGRAGEGSILVVDDEPSVRATLRVALERAGHRVRVAGSVAEAVELLAEDDFEVVVTDLRMPGRSGIDLLVEARSRAPGTRLILISAYADVQAASSAIEQGIDYLLAKPFCLDDFNDKVEESIARSRAEAALRRKQKRLEARLELSEAESRTLVRRAAHALACAVEAKDRYTAGHAQRVTAYAMVLAEAVGGIDPVSFRLAGELHDVGKIGVPDPVLNKPGRLTPEEFAQVREHPEIGARILAPLIDDLLVLGVVLSHHERWDGRGYPEGLAGEAIPLPARMLAVADTLDAMTSRRAYRDALSWEAAVAEIRRCTGTQFDPQVVAAFERALPPLKSLHAGFWESARP